MSESPSGAEFASRAPFAIRTQSVLYNTPLEAIGRSLEYYDNAARLTREAGDLRELVVAYGD